MEFSHELILPNDDLPFKLFLFEGQDGNYIREKHWHRAVEIFAVLEGGLDFYTNEEETHLEEGDFIIVNSNEVHSVKAPERNMTAVIQIPLKSFEKYYTEEEFISFLHGENEKDTQMMELIKNIYFSYEEKKLGYEMKVQGLYFMLMYLLVTHYREVDVSVDTVKQYKNLNKLSQITNYIKDNYTTELSLEGVASVFGYSSAYLSRMFQKYADINYKDYLQSVRVENARKELLNTDYLLGEIAEHNGFSDGRAFTKAFRKRYGMVPSEYKRSKKCT